MGLKPQQRGNTHADVLIIVPHRNGVVVVCNLVDRRFKNAKFDFSPELERHIAAGLNVEPKPEPAYG